MTLKIRTRLLLCVIMFSALIADAWAMMVYCGWAKNWIVGKGLQCRRR